jgi:hypothetical protein
MKNLKTALLTTPAALLTSPVALTFELYDQSRLAQLLTDHPVRLTEIERFVYTQWE